MTPTFLQRWRRFGRSAFLGPKDLLLRAAAISVFFLMAHLAGLSEYTLFLSGTIPAPDVGWERAAFGGLVYLILYFAFVLLVPILLLAACFQGLLTSICELGNRRRQVELNRADQGRSSAVLGRFRWHNPAAHPNLPAQDED
jgi:hypothetical protein